MNELSAEKKESIKRAIEQKLAALMAFVDDTAILHNAQQLHDTEKSIAALTDEIAGCVIESVVTRAVESEELNEEGKTLTKQALVRMKNRGVRTVEIQPYRGTPFTVNATYYTKAGQSAKKADKKGGSIQG